MWHALSGPSAWRLGQISRDDAGGAECIPMLEASAAWSVDKILATGCQPEYGGKDGYLRERLAKYAN